MARKSRKHQPNEISVINEPKAPVYAAYGYTRISRNGDRADDSIEGQTALITEYAASRADLDLKGFYSDLGFSGTTFDRPAVQELIDGVKSGVVQCVVTKDLSRVGRTFIEVGELLFDTFPKYGVRYISVNDDYDSFADDADRKKLLILFKNLMNSMYSRDLAQKIQSAFDSKKERGEPLGIPSYGYFLRKGTTVFEIDEAAAEVVRRIFDLRLNGGSLADIARRLNRNNVTPPMNHLYNLGLRTNEKYAKPAPWTPTIISKILYNEAYIGTLVQGKYDCDGKRKILLPKDQWRRWPNRHPAIVDEAAFYAVQKLMADGAKLHTRWKKNDSVPPNIYLGKLFCGRCGKALSRSNGSRNNFNYSCRTCKDEIKYRLNVKRYHVLTITTLNAAITATLRAQMAMLVDFDKLLSELSQSDPFAAKRAGLKRELAKAEVTAANAEKTLSAAYIHMLNGVLEPKDYDLIRAKTEREKTEAEGRKAYISGELSKLGIHTAQNNAWLKQFRAFQNFDTPTQELIDALVKTVYYSPETRELRVELNYADAFAELRTFAGSADDAVLQTVAAESGVGGND